MNDWNYSGINLAVLTSRWKTFYSNAVYTVTFGARQGKLAEPRPTYTEVFGTAKCWEVRNVYTVKTARVVPKSSGTSTNILAVPCPKS